MDFTHGQAWTAMVCCLMWSEAASFRAAAPQCHSLVLLWYTWTHLAYSSAWYALDIGNWLFNWREALTELLAYVDSPTSQALQAWRGQLVGIRISRHGLVQFPSYLLNYGSCHTCIWWLLHHLRLTERRRGGVQRPRLCSRRIQLTCAPP